MLENKVENTSPVSVQTIREIVIGKDGKINGFPGFEHPDLVNYYLEEVTDRPYVKFTSEFTMTDDGGCMMIWLIQPDGRYWSDDDGYGGSNALELYLYAYLDDQGNFLSKFKIYKCGRDKYFGTDLEDKKYEKFLECIKNGKRF